MTEKVSTQQVSTELALIAALYLVPGQDYMVAGDPLKPQIILWISPEHGKEKLPEEIWDKLKEEGYCPE